jgi:hypothetical protein
MVPPTMRALLFEVPSGSGKHIRPKLAKQPRGSNMANEQHETCANVYVGDAADCPRFNFQPASVEIFIHGVAERPSAVIGSGDLHRLPRVELMADSLVLQHRGGAVNSRPSEVVNLAVDSLRIPAIPASLSRKIVNWIDAAFSLCHAGRVAATADASSEGVQLECSESSTPNSTKRDCDTTVTARRTRSIIGDCIGLRSRLQQLTTAKHADNPHSTTGLNRTKPRMVFNLNTLRGLLNTGPSFPSPSPSTAGAK